MHDERPLGEGRVPGLPREPEALPSPLDRPLLERNGIRISAVREQITADLAGSESVLKIDEVAWDQACLRRQRRRHCRRR